jgi:hypothetical protein
MSSEAIPLSKITAARKVEVVIVFSDLSDLFFYCEFASHDELRKTLNTKAIHAMHSTQNHTPN